MQQIDLTKQRQRSKDRPLAATKPCNKIRALCRVQAQMKLQLLEIAKTEHADRLVDNAGNED